MWGNVVSIGAPCLSLTAMDLDHLFPWSRGGRSTLDNLAAVQFAANRNAKRE
jgi:5-methylcytosine-specific restriction endonuclease McrA